MGRHSNNGETGYIGEPFHMFLGGEAQAWLFDCRNLIDQVKFSLHPILQGFIPKAVGYAARLKKKPTSRSLGACVSEGDIRRAKTVQTTTRSGNRTGN